jgi:hypothetical protein
MRSRDEEEFGRLIEDLQRELPPLVWKPMLAGMALGFMAGIFATVTLAWGPSGVGSNYQTRRWYSLTWVALPFGLGFVGAIVGLAIGLGLDQVFGRKGDAGKKKKRLRKKRKVAGRED